MKLRKVEIAAILDEVRECATCPTILEEHDEKYCRTCAPYWQDVENGLFDDWKSHLVPYEIEIGIEQDMAAITAQISVTHKESTDA